MSYEKLTPESPEAHSGSPVDANVAALAELFPSVMQDGQVDFDALRTLLGDAVEPDEHERFGLHWRGKKKARWLAMQPSLGTLRPCREESLNWDTTKNLYIEGDNLEVLKLLRRSYSGRVKMIYIDPPYNTGKDFVYTDDYRDNIENYKKVTKQEEKYGVNLESDGRFHTKWLNLMLPRLIVARDLLQDSGVVFISINDHEIGNLKLLCDEVFGNGAFVSCFAWLKGREGGNNSRTMGSHFEYILCYCKKSDDEDIINLDCKDMSRHRRCEKEPNLVAGIIKEENEGELYQLVNISKQKGYTVKIPLIDGDVVTYQSFAPQTTVDQWIKCGKIFVGTRHVPYVKSYLKDELQGQKPSNILDQEYGTTKRGSIEIRELMGDREIFSYPKPTALLKRLLTLGSLNDSICLDFFSGSASTAHAVMQLNAEDGGNRRFIMVQLPERCDETSEAYKAGYKNICEIGKERIRRAGRKIKEDAELTRTDLDVGFRVYKLDSSNVRAWNPEVEGEDLLAKINRQGEHLVTGRTGEDFLTEIMLKCGIDILEDIEEREIAGHRVQSLGYGQYYSCMDENLARDAEQVALGVAEWHREEVEAAGVGASDTGCVVFVLDQAFEGEDAAKMNFVEILKQYGISNVKAF